MKRILSLDFLRGLAIFGMMASHVLLHISLYANDFDAALALPGYLVPVFVIVYILSNFRAFFLMISMTVHMYTMNMTLKRGVAPIIMLKKQIVMGFMLYLVGLFCEGIAANWGVIGRSMEAGYWRGDQIHHIMHFETLNSIALCIILTSLIYYFLVIHDGIKKERRNIIVFAVIGVIFVALAPFIHTAINTAYGGYYYDKAPGESWAEQYQFDSVGEFFTKLGLAMLAGLEQPIFPFMGTACLGAIIGIFLSRESVPADLPRKGTYVGLLIMLSGIIVLAATGFKVSLTFDVHPTWFFLVLNGLEVMLFMLVLRRVEFNPKIDIQRFARRSQFLRRWAMISLSLFVWQIVIELPIRWLGTAITGYNYNIRGQITEFWPTVLMLIAVLFVWDLILRLWEKGQFKGSFEWGMATLAQKVLSGKRSTEKAERMDIQGVLYKPEPIIFVKPAEK